MNSILKDFINESYIIIYLDDILIYTMDFKEHNQLVRQVLQVLRQNWLYLQYKKCIFTQKTIKYLGFIISNKKIHIDPKKVKAIQV